MAEQVAPGAPVEARGLFVRQSSGLIREFRPADVFVFNTLGYATGLVLAVVPTFIAALWPEQNVLLVVAIGTVLTLFNAAMYGYLAGIMPRSGGDYVYLSSVVHPRHRVHGQLGLHVVAVPRPRALLRLRGELRDRDRLRDARQRNRERHARELERGRERRLGGLPDRDRASSCSCCSSLSLNTRVIRNIFLIGFIPALLGTFVTLGVLFTTSKEEFVANFNSFMAERADGQTYQGLDRPGLERRLLDRRRDVLGALLALPLGYWIYIGFTYSAYIGGEVKQASKTQPRMIIATLAVRLRRLHARLLALLRRRRPGLHELGRLPRRTTRGIPVAPVLNFFVGIMTGSTVLNVIMGVSFILWNVLLLFVIAMICTRNLFAWSFDGVAPRQLATVGERTHAPWVAAILITAIAVVLLALYVFTSFFTIVVNYIVIFSVAFWMTSFAAILLPYRRRDLFEQAPEAARRKIAGIPVITLLGVGQPRALHAHPDRLVRHAGVQRAHGQPRDRLRRRHLRRRARPLLHLPRGAAAARRRPRPALQGDPARIA